MPSLAGTGARKTLSRLLAFTFVVVVTGGYSSGAVTLLPAAALAAPAAPVPAATTGAQPAFRFPWDVQKAWYLSSGPHEWDPGSLSGSGLDFPPNGSSAVLAAAGGEVYFSGTNEFGHGPNLIVRVRHPNGWETWYLHLASSAFGTSGQLALPVPVNQGQYLGEVGSSGADAVHIHIELVHNQQHETWNGKSINGWQVHSDCVGYTAVATCQTGNYNGYIQNLTTGEQKVPSRTPGAAQLVTSVNVQPVIGLLGQPVRLLDTRATGGAVTNGTSRCVQVSGLAGIPPNTTGVILNVTSVGYTTKGWLTLYPNGQAVPATSTLNFDPNVSAIANGTMVKLGTGGQVCVNVGTVNAAPGSAHIVLDATGFLSPSAGAGLPLLAAPVRLADTRNTGPAISTGSSRCFPVAGVGGIPSNASGAILNVTAVGYTTEGWLTLYPSGQAVPLASMLNFDRDEYAIANGTLARLGADGRVCVNVGTINSAPGTTHVVLDATGYMADTAGQMQLLPRPQRLVDTRAGSGFAGAGLPLSGLTDPHCYPLAGVSGIPSGAGGLLLDAAGASPTTNGWITLYPKGPSIPPTSTLNFDVHEYAIANGAVMRLGDGQQLCAVAQAGTNMILDAMGYLAAQTGGSAPMMAPSADGRLFRVDPTPTGSDTVIANLSNGLVATDIAWSDWGALLGESFTSLYRIDPATAAATPIGSFGVGTMNALTFNTAGELFGATFDGQFMRIDTNTGAAKFIGFLGLGAASSGDLIFMGDGTLLATVKLSGFNDVLVRVNPQTGQVARITPPVDLGFRDVFGLAVVDDALYGLTNIQSGCSAGALLQIDPVTGTAKVVRCLAFNANGAAAVPKPTPSLVPTPRPAH
jgi:murein DD-endopeptidase MepM/ murein hydrolase activator NlpD